MPARSIDTATIAFGLVAIPVKIYSTNQPSEELHFHLVHAGCGERLKQQYICPEHGVIEREDMVKGFELTKGNVVELTKEELKALDAVSTDEIALVEFVPISAVDPLYVDKTYYLGPDKGGDRSYRLFRDALEDAELCGIAAYSARGKQYTVMIRPYEDGLVMHQLRYVDEVKPWSDVPLGKLPKAGAPELELAGQVIEQLRHDTFDPSQYADEVKTRVRKLIAQKAKGGEIVAPEHAPRVEMPDLMAALKASLAGESRIVEETDGKRKQAKSQKRGHHEARPHKPTGRKRTSRSTSARASTKRTARTSRSPRAHARRGASRG